MFAIRKITNLWSELILLFIHASEIDVEKENENCMKPLDMRKW